MGGHGLREKRVGRELGRRADESGQGWRGEEEGAGVKPRGGRGPRGRRSRSTKRISRRQPRARVPAWGREAPRLNVAIEGFKSGFSAQALPRPSSAKHSLPGLVLPAPASSSRSFLPTLLIPYHAMRLFALSLALLLSGSLSEAVRISVTQRKHSNHTPQKRSPSPLASRPVLAARADDTNDGDGDIDIRSAPLFRQVADVCTQSHQLLP